MRSERKQIYISQLIRNVVSPFFTSISRPAAQPGKLGSLLAHYTLHFWCTSHGQSCRKKKKKMIFLLALLESNKEREKKREIVDQSETDRQTSDRWDNAETTTNPAQPQPQPPGQPVRLGNNKPALSSSSRISCRPVRPRILWDFGSKRLTCRSSSRNSKTCGQNRCGCRFCPSIMCGYLQISGGKVPLSVSSLLSEIPPISIWEVVFFWAASCKSTSLLCLQWFERI